MSVSLKGEGVGFDQDCLRLESSRFPFVAVFVVSAVPKLVPRPPVREAEMSQARADRKAGTPRECIW